MHNIVNSELLLVMLLSEHDHHCITEINLSLSLSLNIIAKLSSNMEFQLK